MDQGRPETSTNQQQNVHLHMHHVCNCQGSIYPPTYYPTVGYRTPVPSMVPYATPTVPRPYLQHYQYTQFNVGGQYTVPLTHVAPSSGSVYGQNSTGSSSADMVFGTIARDRRERGDSQEGNGDSDRINEPPIGYDYGQVTPPANELLLSENSENASPENFVKFLERSCLTAEQIAYRNRNRPCFRNIQNLCIRTRSEILKPCTTISNIHSQGIPWATKDFIYAFVRLTNCWHILKGYWENRDGSSLGKIEKELTPEFRACYVRWEKETIDLAAQLTRVFYNLDTNLNNPTGVAVHTANNLIPPQVNLLKSSASENTIKKSSNGADTVTTTTSTLTAVSANNNSAKNVRGILHIPSATQTETTDQGNQTCAGDFCSKDGEYDSEEEERRVYMKPGSYSVPKKGISGSDNCGGTSNSPRAIEFLETAQNVNKARETVNDRYWANVHIGGSSSKKPSIVDPKITQEEVEKNAEAVELELNLSSHLNVHEWLINNNFSEFGEPSSPPISPPELRPFFVDPTISYDALANLEVELQQQQKSPTPITVLQRTKTASASSHNNDGQVFKSCKPCSVGGPANGRIEFTSRTYRKRSEGLLKTSTSLGSRRPTCLYENKGGGLTDTAAAIFEKILYELKMSNLMEGVVVDEKNEYSPLTDVDMILKKVKLHEYAYVNEIIRDVRYLIIYEKIIGEHCENMVAKAELFSQKFDVCIAEFFPGFDFSDIKGELNEKVGPLKPKKSKPDTDGDQL